MHTSLSSAVHIDRYVCKWLLFTMFSTSSFFLVAPGLGVEQGMGNTLQKKLNLRSIKPRTHAGGRATEQNDLREEKDSIRKAIANVSIFLGPSKKKQQFPFFELL
jgi:hypothetical protein